MSRLGCLLLLLVVAMPISVGSQTPEDCKKCFADHACSHFPVSDKCFGCCAYDTGKIESVSNSSIVLSQQGEGNQTNKKNFAISKETTTSGRLRSGAQVTVFHRKSEQVADSIDVINDSQFLLKPGSEPDPPSDCPGPIPRDALKIFLAELVGWTSADETVVLQSGGENLLTLRRVAGGLAINATLYDHDHNLTAQIVDNRLYLSASDATKVERKANSLAIVDTRTNESVQFIFLNEHSLRVVGTIYTSNGGRMVITDEDIMINRSHIGGRSCIANVPLGSTMFHF